MTKLAFIDTETTGLDATVHDAWEVAFILVDGDTVTEHEWLIDTDLSTADPGALRINRYYQRAAQLADSFVPRAEAAAAIAPLLDGAVLIGANPAFDERFLTKLLRQNRHAPAWHYRVFDIEAAVAAIGKVQPPWKSSTELCKQVLGVDPPTDEERHTAMGDVRWVKRAYDAVYGRKGTVTVHKITVTPVDDKAGTEAAPPGVDDVEGIAQEGVQPERTPNPLLTASPRKFVAGLAKLTDPVIVAHLLDDAVTGDIIEERVDAVRARLAELQGDTPPAGEEPDDDGDVAPTGRPVGMPAADDRPACDECGKPTEGPPKPGAPSAAQLSWTRYRRVLCFNDLEKMKVTST